MSQPAADPVVHALSPEDNLRAAFHTLHHRVIRALQTQIGDAARLGETRNQALQLLQAVQPVSNSIRLTSPNDITNVL